MLQLYVLYAHKVMLMFVLQLQLLHVKQDFLEIQLIHVQHVQVEELINVQLQPQQQNVKLDSILTPLNVGPVKEMQLHVLLIQLIQHVMQDIHQLKEHALFVLKELLLVHQLVLPLLVILDIIYPLDHVLLVVQMLLFVLVQLML